MVGSGTLRRGADADGSAGWSPADPLRLLADVFIVFAVAFEVMSSLAFVMFTALALVTLVTAKLDAVAVILMLPSLWYLQNTASEECSTEDAFPF